GDELAGELAEAEVELIVAGVSGARDEPPALDADEDWLHLPRGHMDVDLRDVVAEADARVRAGGHRHGEQLALVWRRGYRAGNHADRGPARGTLNAQLRAGDRVSRTTRCNDQQRPACRLQAQQREGRDDERQRRESGAEPQETRSRQRLGARHVWAAVARGHLLDIGRALVRDRL